MPQSTASFLRPRFVEAIARLPSLRTLAHDAWLRLTYRKLWGWRNRKAIRLFAENRPALSPVQMRVLDDLRRLGIARVPFLDLVRDKPWWDQLQEAAASWLASEKVQEARRRYREDTCRSAQFKEHILAQYENRERLGWDSPWLRLGVDGRLLDMVNHYLGMMSRLHHVNFWDTVAGAHERRFGPQRWHRDPDDIRTVKVFLYFSDVDESSGPFQYVPHSRPGEKYGQLWEQDAPLAGAYPPEEDFERRIPRADRLTCTGPAGTILLADTAGFHRGGDARRRDRVLATWAYSSQAAIWPRKFRIEKDDVPADLLLAARCALFATK